MKRLAFRANLLALATTLAGCAISHDRSLGEYDRVSGPAGTLWFAQSYDLRPCSWFECGESSRKRLGAHIAVFRLERIADGRFSLTKLQQVDCKGYEQPCVDLNSPHLRFERGQPRLAPTIIPPPLRAVAWSGLYYREAGANGFLCVTKSTAGLEPSTILKIAPDAGMSRVAQVVSLVHARASRPRDATCASLAALPMPGGLSYKPYLLDAQRAPDGTMHVIYAGRRDPLSFEGERHMIADFDGARWTGGELPKQRLTKDRSSQISPAFLDDRADMVILGQSLSENGRSLSTLVFDRASREITKLTMGLP